MVRAVNLAFGEMNVPAMGPLAVLRARGAVLELHAYTLGEMLVREFVKASLAPRARHGTAHLA